MKKAVLILLACLLICPLFAACEHEHTWSEGEITTAATCEAEGVRTFACTECEQTKTEPVAATGHAWNEGTVTTAATYEEDGVKTFTCTNCAATKTEPLKATTTVTKAEWDTAYAQMSINYESRTDLNDGTSVHFKTCNGITHILTYVNGVLTSENYYEGDYFYTVEGETVIKDKRSPFDGIILQNSFAYENLVYDSVSRSYKAEKIESEYEQEGVKATTIYTNVEIKFLNGALFSESYCAEEVVTVDGAESRRDSRNVVSTYGTVAEIVIPTPTVDKTRPTVTAEEWADGLNLLRQEHYNHMITSTINGAESQTTISKINTNVFVVLPQGQTESWTVEEDGSYHRFPAFNLGPDAVTSEWYYNFEYHNVFSYNDFTYDEATKSYVAERCVYEPNAGNSDSNDEPQEWVFTNLSFQFVGGKITKLSYTMERNMGTGITVTRNVETITYGLLSSGSFGVLE